MLMDSKEALTKIGKLLISKLRSNLKAEGHYATGVLDRSFDMLVAEKELRILADASLFAISEGRKKSNKLPSGEMVSRIVQWMRAKGIPPLVRREKGQRRGGRLRKNTESVFKKAAFSIGMSILHKGHKGSKVIERSYNDLESKIDKEILDLFKTQVEKEFTNITIS